jgi:hypothetical protein
MDKMKHDYSNRTLAYLVLVALIVSVIGSLMTLSRIGGFGVPLITGAASSGTGTTQVAILSQLAITIIDSTIDYGTCKPGIGNTTFFDSNNSAINGSDESECTGMSNPQNITIENTGNVGANISIQTNTIDLTGSVSGLNKSLWFSWRNATNSAGCYKATRASGVWYNFTAIATDNVTCENLTWTSANKRLWFYLRVWMPPDATAAARTATITFTAGNSYGP